MKETVIKKIYDGLKEKIRSGEITSRVVEQDLAEAYGVSRTPMREVIRQLVKEGVLRSIPNLGTFVKQYTLQEVKDIYEIRSGLESLAAGLAAKRISSKDAGSLLKLAKKIENKRLKEDWEAVYELDREFHKKVAHYSGNANLANLLEDYDFKITCAYANLFQAERFKGKTFQGISHEAIAEAIKNNDSDEAEKLVRAHIEWAKQQILLD